MRRLAWVLPLALAACFETPDMTDLPPEILATPVDEQVAGAADHPPQARPDATQQAGPEPAQQAGTDPAPMQPAAEAATGFLALFRRGPVTAPVVATATGPADDPEMTPIAQSPLGPEPSDGELPAPDNPAHNTGDPAADAPTGGGFLAGLFRRSSRPDPATPGAAPVDPAFGIVKKVCDLDPKDRGHEIVSTPAGGPHWTLYDTIPNATAPRDQFITGFADGCARRVHAALVLFGSPTAWETVRYSNWTGRYTRVDNGYERIKGRICGVRRKSPCPLERLDALESSVMFVTAYPAFGSSDGPQLEILLHSGRLVAAQVRDR